MTLAECCYVHEYMCCAATPLHIQPTAESTTTTTIRMQKKVEKRIQPRVPTFAHNRIFDEEKMHHSRTTFNI